MWEISGGKTYFGMYKDEFEKHCNRTIKSRNERIAEPKKYPAISLKFATIAINDKTSMEKN